MSIIPSAAPNALTELTPERLAEIKDLLRYESSIAFYSHRAKESMLLLVSGVEQLTAERSEVEQKVRAELAAKRAEVVEYGVAFKATDQDDVEVHTPTDSREEAEARVSRYLDMYPTAHLVQRTVRHGEWTEVAS